MVLYWRDDKYCGNVENWTHKDGVKVLLLVKDLNPNGRTSKYFHQAVHKEQGNLGHSRKSEGLNSVVLRSLLMGRLQLI